MDKDVNTIAVAMEVVLILSVFAAAKVLDKTETKAAFDSVAERLKAQGTEDQSGFVKKTQDAILRLRPILAGEAEENNG